MVASGRRPSIARRSETRSRAAVATGRLHPQSCRETLEKEARRARLVEQTEELRLRNPEQQHVLRGDGVALRGPVRDEGGKSEALAGLDDLEQLAVALQPHAPLAHDPQRVARSAIAGEDGLAAGCEAHLEDALHAVERLRREGVERGVPREKRLRRDRRSAGNAQSVVVFPGRRPAERGRGRRFMPGRARTRSRR
jgi:hypothetical protein